MIKEAIETLVSGNSLNFEQAAGAMEEIMSGETTPAQIAAFVTALRIKGETVDEIAGLASVMRDKAIPVKVTHASLALTLASSLMRKSRNMTSCI